MEPTRSAESAKPAFRVLVIDDNEIDREICIRHLDKAWPFDREMIVESAGNGRDALAKMSAARFALVVLDWRLPEMGGSDVLATMRRNGMRVSVVVISGLHRAHIADDIESLGAAFLNKDEMNAITLHSAIATSLRLLGLSPATQPARTTG